MPPTFLAFLAIILWLAVASTVGCAALLMLLFKRTKLFSKPLACAMVFTAPFVLAYDLIAAVPVSVVLIASWGFWKLLEPGASTFTKNQWIIGLSIASAFFALGMMMAASLTGLYDGWRVGWSWGNGQKLRVAILSAPVYQDASVRVLTLVSRLGRQAVKRTD